MKKILCLFAVGLMFMVTSCTKLETNLPEQPLVQVENRDAPIEVIFKFKHPSFFGSQCDDGSCGTCLGICLIIRFKTAQAAQLSGESDLGSAYAEVKSGKLSVIPLSSVDDGSGKIYVKNDVDIDYDFATFIGHDAAFTVEAGEYEIDYSTETYGEILFDIE